MTRTERRRGRYGAAHQRARLDYLSRYQPGITPCARCGEPMDEDPALLDLDHSDDGPGYLGLSHRTCNRTYGRHIVPRGRNQRAPRVCERCFTTYQPSHCDQRWCSRACAASARHVDAKAGTTKVVRQCVECGALTERPKYCGGECAKAAAKQQAREYMRNRYRKQVGIPLDAPKWSRAR